MDSSGIQGASSDGILDEETVLEAKCHYTKCSLTVEEAVNTSKSFCLEKFNDGHGFVLKREHVYWDHVQGKMFFHFIVCTSKVVVVFK